MSLPFNHEHMYTYLKGYATAKRWTQTLAALRFAREKHKGQTRKTGEPYIIHPLTMACHAVALGVDEDAAIAAMLYHDVPEDCGVKADDLPASVEVRVAVHRLTHVKGEPLEPYYRGISEDRIATLVKIFDSCDNLSTMADAFSRAKMIDYIHEKREYVIPLIRVAKDSWPDNHNALFVLKYHTLSVVDSLEKCLQTDVKDLRLRVADAVEEEKSEPVKAVLRDALKNIELAATMRENATP